MMYRKASAGYELMAVVVCTCCVIHTQPRCDPARVRVLRALPTKVVEVYSAIGRLLRTYTAGKLPKAFKIIPSIANWEQVGHPEGGTDAPR